jgi:ribose 5-phosphate isomerase B
LKKRFIPLLLTLRRVEQWQSRYLDQLSKGMSDQQLEQKRVIWLRQMAAFGQGMPNGFTGVSLDVLDCALSSALALNLHCPVSMEMFVEGNRANAAPPKTMRIGIAADHAGYELRQYLFIKLNDAGYEVIDFGDRSPKMDDDYPNFVIPMAQAVASGKVERGVAICGSGVGASVAANKVLGVRACLIHESFSAHQGVEDDNLNVICLGGLVVGHASAWELVQTFLAAQFSGAERHRRRLDEIAALEKRELSKAS